MTAYTIGWLAWIAWFCIEEGLAFASGKTPNTLSGHFWHWFSINAHEPWWRFRRFVALAGLSWLLLHLLTGGVF